MKILIYCTILLSVVCLVAINANLPAYADLNGISSETTGWIVSMNPLMCLIFTFPFAYLSDRYNRFVVIFAGLFFYFFAALVLVFFNSLTGLFIVKILEGLAVAAFLPSATAFITDLSKKGNLSQDLGSFTSVFNLGFLIAPASSAFLGNFFGLQAIFIFVLVCSVINLIICIPIYILFKQSSISKSLESEVVEFKKSDLKSFKWPVIISVGLFSVIFGYSLGLYDSIWAYYIFDLGGDIFILNLTYFCYALPVVLLSRFMGKLADKYENLHLPIILGSLMISFSILSYGFIPVPLIIAFVCSIEGVGNAAVFPCMNAAMLKSVDKYFKGRVLGIFNIARTGGNFIGAIVCGYLFTLTKILPFIVNFSLILITAIIATVTLFLYKEDLKDT
ncbi:MAG: MFS transporter [Cyanobacteriota bacterium]